MATLADDQLCVPLLDKGVQRLISGLETMRIRHCKYCHVYNFHSSLLTFRLSEDWKKQYSDARNQTCEPRAMGVAITKLSGLSGRLETYLLQRIGLTRAADLPTPSQHTPAHDQVVARVSRSRSCPHDVVIGFLVDLPSKTALYASNAACTSPL